MSENQLLTLKKREEEAYKQGDAKLYASIKIQRLKLEQLETEKVLSELGEAPKIFAPKKHMDIEPVKIEIEGRNYLPLVKNAYNIIAGRGGSGKSAIALKSMLVWLKDNPTKTALAFFTEDAILEIQKRAEIICSLNAFDKNLIDRVFFISLDNDDRIKWVDKKKEEYVINHEYISEVVNFCKSNNTEYVLLDPLKRFHRLSENSNDDMDVLVRDIFTDLAIKTNSILLVIHHSSKGEGGARGAGTITDSARLAYSVDRYFMKNEEGKTVENEKFKGKIRLEFIKDNFGLEKDFNMRGEAHSIDNPLTGAVVKQYEFDGSNDMNMIFEGVGL